MFLFCMVNIYMCVCVCVCVYIYIYIYIYIYTDNKLDPKYDVRLLSPECIRTRIVFQCIRHTENT